MGAGAVGTYLGNMLQAIGNDVVYAPRELERVEPVDADVAIVAVKSYDTPAAIATLRKAIVDPGKCPVITPQNGIGNEEQLVAAFGNDNVIAAGLTTPLEQNGPQRAKPRGGIAFAPLGERPNNWLWAAFERTGFPIQVVADWRALKWSKLSLNIIANASCAILNVLPERVVHFDDVFALEIRAIREVRAVMKGLRIKPVDLPNYPVRLMHSIATLPTPVARMLLADRVVAARGRKPPSLLLDLRAGKEVSEVDVLNGAVASAAQHLHIAAPVNTIFCRVLQDIANMPQLWAKYRERPEALVAEVDAEVRRVQGLKD